MRPRATRITGEAGARRVTTDTVAGLFQPTACPTDPAEMQPSVRKPRRKTPTSSPVLESRACVRLACGVLLTLCSLLATAPARADGSFPEPRQILLPADRPEQIILSTNFGLMFSEDRGATWVFSCERELSNYAGPYLLGAQNPHRIFALAPGAGLIHTDDDSCSWQAAGGTLGDVLLFAVAVDPSNSQRVYTTGAPRNDLRHGQSIYVSDDGGLSFAKTVFTSPDGSALLSIMVAPSRPSTLFATMFSTPENHPSLLRSDDSGENWEVVADLASALGEDPFDLLAIDALDEDRLYVRILGASAETLAISDDGGQSFVKSVSIPGKLNAFLKLGSGSVMIAGTAGRDAVGYRSKDGGQTFEVWSNAPHGHALAERGGKLYIAGDGYADGYALAESEDEGEHLSALTTFKQVRAVKSCVADLCSDSCAYYSGVGLWPETVCGAGPALPMTDDPAGTGGAPDASAGSNATGSQAGGVAGADRGHGDGGLPAQAGTAGVVSAGAPSVDHENKQAMRRISGGGCACDLVGARRRRGYPWSTLLVAVSMAVARRRGRDRGATDSRTRRRQPAPP